MDYKDYYATLGVKRDASQDEIQKAYRKLARKLHPDVNKDPKAEGRFKEINEAYEVLKDPEKRQKYDRFGQAWKQREQTGTPPPGWENVRFDFGDFDFGPGGAAEAQGFSSFFDMLFGDRGRGGGAGAAWGTAAPGAAGAGRGFRRRGADREATITLSLGEAASGGTREVTMLDPDTGARQTFQVAIPPGVRPGQRIRLSGKGAQGAGGAGAGDLYLRVEHTTDPRFRLEGKDLHVEVPVTPWEAALGGQVNVPTLNGSGVQIRVPAGTSSGRRIRLRGKGFPGRRGEEPGDLYAELRIAVPDELTPRERELFEELARVSQFAPRQG